MKKYIAGLVIFFLPLASFSQTVPELKLIRKDTLVLNALESNWVIGSASSSSNEGKSLPFYILKAVRLGKLKATDGQTGQPIPASKIFTWGMPSDTVAMEDKSGNRTYKVIQAEMNPNQIKGIRVFQDWFLDTGTGKISSKVTRMELIKEVYSASGIKIGRAIFCFIDF